MVGSSLKHYRIVEKIGEGGMGVVYRALDTHLDRTVAVKVLRPEAVEDAERKWRFVREAKAASALNHPHIVTIHDIDSNGGVDFLVMEYVEGKPLDRLIPKEGLPVAQALDCAVQIASALGAAHAAGIVHRDVKPANVMVGPAGIKVLDFGLAKLVERGDAGAQTTDSTATAERALPRTRDGVILGTVAYMSPEQAQGNPVDARSDVFSFGSVLYEMLAGRRPFRGDSQLMTLASILRDPPVPLASVRRDVPPGFERIVRRSLEKRPEDRYPTAEEMAADLAALKSGRPAAAPLAGRARRRPWLVYPAIAIVLAGIAVAAAALVRASRVRHAKTVDLPEVARLIEQQKPAAAVRLAGRAEKYVPADVARLRGTWVPATLTTDPPGANAWIRDYLSTEADWQPMGKTPVRARLPQGYYRWKISKAGYAPIEAAGFLNVTRRLDPVSAPPAGMVRVAGGSFSLRSLNPVTLDDFWIDKYEVTNREFKAFMDAGGYAKPEYWKQPFLLDGREVPWKEAVGRFRDTTGRPGPSTWELGTYPEGKGDFPVDGVSWYEAVAYAEFTGKSLPTVYHWYRAAGMGPGLGEIFSEILRVSNFGGKGPWAFGTGQGMSAFGTYDQAGNVKEWCWNATERKRYILGGSWAEPNYMFRESDAQDPFARAAGYGFRCARYAAAPSGFLTEAIPALSRDYTKETPVSDEVFRVYQSLYAYDRGPLDARLESEEDFPYWRRQKVSILAAYGNERIPIFLFLPKNAKPPYQTVVYFPNSYARILRTSADLDMTYLDFVIRSGRALVHPIYKDTYDRGVDRQPAAEFGSNLRRDLVIQWSKDLGRSLDYLETRPDLDRRRLAYYGSSLGAIDGVVLVALEPRFQTAIFLAGGFRFPHAPPEVEPINFAPRIRIPVLLIGGRYDFAHPYETAQQPMFRLLGTPEKDKKHFVFEGGHAAPKTQAIIKEILDWLDRYLGPVAPAG